MNSSNGVILISENNDEINNVAGKAILAPTNIDVDFLNETALI